MDLKSIAKLGLILAFSATLTGCMDVTADVELISETTASIKLTQVMGADFYAMASSAADGIQKKEGAYCSDGDLTEEADGSATCAFTEEGTFEQLSTIKTTEPLRFTSSGPGLVRVAVPTSALFTAVGGDEEIGPETQQMVEAFFAGRALTFRVSGGEITETNMTVSKDRETAQEVIPFLEIINGSADLPEEFYAVVRVK